VWGRELWRHPLPLATTAGGFGSGTSPLIVGDKVILCRDLAANSVIMAVDVNAGKTLWETPRSDSPTSYGSPILRAAEGGAEIIAGGSLSMRAYDVASGAERWVVRGLPSYTCTTPVLGDGLVFFAGWSPGKSDSPWPSWESTAERLDKNKDGKISPEEFDSGPAWFKAQDVDRDGFITAKDWELIGGLMKRGENVLLAVRPGGQGDVTATHVVWKATRGLPYVPSPLYFEGRVYLIRDGGMMSSFDAKTGQPYYQQERVKDALGSYYASPVAADGRIFVVSLQGKLSVIKAGGDHPEVLQQADFAEPISATPALVGDRLYLRTKTKLYAFGDGATR
jgi:outer membrane protein assembly factor BamB